MNKIAFLGTVSILLAGSSAGAQGDFYNSNPVAPPSQPGLTNSYGSTVFTPNSPVHTLGGTPPPMHNNYGASSNNVIIPDSNEDTDKPKTRVVTGTPVNP